MPRANPRKTPYSVMLSSTFKELAEPRRAVREAMLGQRLMPIAMEDDAALPDQDLIDASLAKVDEADAYVGLISYRYGQTPHDPVRNPEGLSLTELEFRRAVERKLPICMFIMHGDYLVPRSEVGKERGSEEKFTKFLQLAKDGRIYAEFKSVDDLKAKAVQSLVELRVALERRSGSGAVPKEQGPQHALSNIPITVPRHFLGRDKSLAAIDAALAGNSGRVAVTALHGLRGVGKSTLAAAYAERHRENYRATWWIRAESESGMRADLVALGVRLGWVAADEKEEPALATVMEKLRDDGAGILLVYDNAIDAKAIRPYLPRGGQARALITSNAPAWRGVAEPLEIDVWPKKVGADYLIARTGRAAEREAAEALSEALGGLPLAHEQAAAYCEDLGVGFADYQRRFEAEAGKFLDDKEYAPEEYHNRRTVFGTFSLAIDEAAKRHPAAEPLLVHAALLAPEPIPLYLFSEAREEFGEPLASALAGDSLDKAVAALRTFALVDRQTVADERDTEITTDCLRLHRLVRQVAAARCVGDEWVRVRGGLIAALATVYPRGVYNDPKSWPRARRLDAHGLAIVEDCAPEDEIAPATASLLDRLAGYRQSVLAAYSAARPLHDRALVVREKVLGPDHPDTATSLNNLAGLLKVQGNLAAAKPLCERALAIREKTLGPDHPQTARILSNLAGVLEGQLDLAGARLLFERALEIHENTLGPDNRDTATGLNNLALCLRNQGEFDAARPLLERALAIRKKELGPNHPHTAISLNNLALLLSDQGDFAAAQPLFEDAVTISERTLGAEHPDTATSLSNLGRLVQNRGNLSAARPFLEQALSIYQAKLGSEHPITHWGGSNLARLLTAIGEVDRALKLAETALAAHDKVLGPHHPWTKDSARVTARALGALGRAKEAAALRARYGVTE